MDERRWRVGELADQAGLTVRALHHFDQIGLLRPTERSAAGHRLYTAEDVRRLYRIVALRQLGMAAATPPTGTHRAHARPRRPRATAWRTHHTARACANPTAIRRSTRAGTSANR